MDRTDRATIPLRRIAVAGFASAAVVLATFSPATAADTPADLLSVETAQSHADRSALRDRPSATTRGAAVPSLGTTAMTAFAQRPSPAGCTGRTDYPHKSGTTVSVHSQMECRYAVPRVETGVALYRDRWYGREYIGGSSGGRNNSSWSGRVTPHISCAGNGTYSYRAYGAHASLEGGTIYRAYTSNWQIPGKSRFAC